MTYRLSVDFFYRIKSSSQDAKFIVSSNNTAQLKLSGSGMTNGAVTETVKNGSSITHLIQTRPYGRGDQWNSIQLEFTADNDGYIDLKFEKSDLGYGADRDGTAMWFDNVQIVPVKY